MERTPFVSICCLTYNHAPYIRECLDSFLMQKVNFFIEILIHDDASTDGTIDILREYGAKYPDIIFPIYETENKYSNGYSGQMDFFNYHRARGKYIAYCEGDDYWTDPLKLQKQVDFMEANPEYTICFTRFKKLFNDGSYLDDLCAPFLEGNPEGIDIDVETYFKSWITQGLTAMFRKNAFSYEWQKAISPGLYCDFFEYYFLIRAGKGRLMNFYSGVYRISGKGSYSSKNDFNARKNDIDVARDLLRVTRDKQVKQKFNRTLQYMIDGFAKNKEHKKEISHYIVEQFFLFLDFKTLAKNIFRTFYRFQ